jgi:hypothetical protein
MCLATFECIHFPSLTNTHSLAVALLVCFCGCVSVYVCVLLLLSGAGGIPAYPTAAFRGLLC